MSVPKQRHTKERRDRKRKRFAVVAKKTVECPKCKSQKLPHLVCKKCGYYKGKEVVNTMKKVGKKKAK